MGYGTTQKAHLYLKVRGGRNSKKNEYIVKRAHQHARLSQTELAATEIRDSRYGNGIEIALQRVFNGSFIRLSYLCS